MVFTGLVESLAAVVEIVPEPPGVRLVIREPRIAAESAIGDSIALNGCCLTVVAIAGDNLSFQAGDETLSRTNLGELKSGDPVNLERSLKLGDAIGGHLVSGHIDAVGTVDRRTDDADWCTMWFRVPPALTSQMASKGSIAVDGVSLTLVEVESRPLQRGPDPAYAHRHDPRPPQVGRPGQRRNRRAGQVRRKQRASSAKHARDSVWYAQMKPVITDIDFCRTPAELEQYFLSCILAGGKTASDVERKINAITTEVPEGVVPCNYLLKKQSLEAYLRQHKTGMYTRLVKAISAITKLDIKLATDDELIRYRALDSRLRGCSCSVRGEIFVTLRRHPHVEIPSLKTASGWFPTRPLRPTASISDLRQSCSAYLTRNFQICRRRKRTEKSGSRIVARKERVAPDEFRGIVVGPVARHFAGTSSTRSFSCRASAMRRSIERASPS